MTVGLYLMTEKSLPVLSAALASDVVISHVTVAEARGMSDDSHELIARVAKREGIPVFTRNPPPGYGADFTIASGWRWMLAVPNLIVLHDSLLPRYRGFSPLVTALVKGDYEVGVTAFLAEEGGAFDAGPIIAQRSMPVTYPTTMRETIFRIGPLYHDLAQEILQTIASGEPLRYARQDERDATYSIWRDEDDFRIDWTKRSDAIRRLVDAASHPFSGAWTFGNDFSAKLTVWKVEEVPDLRFEERHPGKIARFENGNPVVVCGGGMLKLTHTSRQVTELKTRLA